MLFLFIFLLSTGIFLGHFIYGLKFYLPKTSGENQTAQLTTKAVFHYVSLLYILYLGYLTGHLAGAWQADQTLMLFLGLWFCGCGMVNLFYGVRAGLLKIFQWVFFFPLGILLLVWSVPG